MRGEDGEYVVWKNSTQNPREGNSQPRGKAR